MPITSYKVKKLAQQYQSEKLVSDGLILKCQLCEIIINIDDKHQKSIIQQHLKSARHRKLGLKCDNSLKQLFLQETELFSDEKSIKGNEFTLDLTKAFVQSGIPLFKINSVPLKAFFGKYTKQHIPDESTLRKNYVKPIYTNTIQKIKNIVSEHPVALIIDETTDIKQRHILNILVLPLTGKPVSPMLLNVSELEKTNNMTIMQSFNDACGFLWDGKIAYENVWLVVTDQASYMLLAFRKLKAMYPNLKHVTCLAHSLHRVCESIRDKYKIVNEFLGCMKRIFLKSPLRNQIFKEVTQGFSMPPDVVVTRWGSWISCAVYYCKNFNIISEFINALPDDSVAVTNAKKLIECEILKDELFNVSRYSFLPESIKKLEKQGMLNEDQWNIYMEAYEGLVGFAEEKLTASLGKNPDAKEMVTEKNPEIRHKTQYAPLVSVDVERSFSQYKLMLSDLRQNLTMENIKYLNVIAYNKFLFD